MKSRIVPLLFCLGCSGNGNFGDGDPTDLGDEVDYTEIHPSCEEDSSLILETPESGDYGRFHRKGFTRYSQVVAPNGGVIPLFAQDEISEGQLLRARNLLRFFLTDVPDTTWGADKSEVANQMAERGAALMMPNGAHEEGNEPNLPAQPLYADETPVEGDRWFMNNNYNHRDAAFEEIFHLVHDAGIGTDEPGALPDYQYDLDQEARAAIEDGRWGIPIDPQVTDWIEELERENSLAQEYIASVIDSYYGLWGPWDEGDGGMWGIYIAKTREEESTLDPAGKALLEQYLSPTLTTEVRLDPDLDQDFSMAFSEDEPYTHKSQYFQHVTLTGFNAVSLYGNDEDNTLRGNRADNTLDGANGEDTAIYCQVLADYTLSRNGDDLLVSGEEDTDTLVDIEWIHFADGRVSASDF